MTRAHAVLWSVILLATVADIVLTMTGVANGLREGNVVVAAALAEFGIAGLWLVKFAAMLWLVAPLRPQRDDLSRAVCQRDARCGLLQSRRARQVVWVSAARRRNLAGENAGPAETNRYVDVDRCVD